MKPKVLILRAPGTNCDVETAFAFTVAGADCDCVHINRLLEKPDLLGGYQVLCLPGGFSFGDDIAAGRIMATRFRNHLLEPITNFKEDGKLILGICNGFQILIKSGILLADTPGGSPATLAWNVSGMYTDRWVKLSPKSDRCVFLRGIDEMFLPIAHAEGRFVGRDNATLDTLEANGQLVLRYIDGTNPNGAERDVAGVCDSTGRVFGLMPHPERFIVPTQHPHWTRYACDEQVKRNWRNREVGDGLAIFRNAVSFFA
ncbi:MAG: phosphoribosylformylglycinamidine synthase I [Planctomycetaceae bacterium]|jgi:phosphoribosylformylglycinamidine synthase|nr:phosphoribosylformylglycinamidine synthase I [Planctomycetaceae bacterium]